MMALNEILNKINELPDEFEQNFENKKWRAAAIDYEQALLVSRFIRMDDEARERLIGRFDQSKVETAFTKANRNREALRDVERAANRKAAV